VFWFTFHKGVREARLQRFFRRLARPESCIIRRDFLEGRLGRLMVHHRPVFRGSVGRAVWLCLCGNAKIVDTSLKIDIKRDQLNKKR
jgi:hypothetical protein